MIRFRHVQLLSCRPSLQLNEKDLIIEGSSKHQGAGASKSQPPAEGVISLEDEQDAANCLAHLNELAGLNLGGDAPELQEENPKKRRRVETRREQEQRKLAASGSGDPDFFLSKEDAYALLNSWSGVPRGLQHMFGTGVPTFAQLVAFFGHLMIMTAASGPSQSHVEGLGLEIRDLKEKLGEAENERQQLRKSKGQADKEISTLKRLRDEFEKERDVAVKRAKVVEEDMKKLVDGREADIKKLTDDHEAELQKLKVDHAKEMAELSQCVLDDYVKSSQQAARIDYFAEYRFLLLDLKYRRALLEAGSIYEMDYTDYVGFAKQSEPYVPAPLGAFEDDDDDTLESFKASSFNKGTIAKAFQGKMPSGAGELKKALLEARGQLLQLKAERARVEAVLHDPLGKVRTLEFEADLLKTCDLTGKSNLSHPQTTLSPPVLPKGPPGVSKIPPPPSHTSKKTTPKKTDDPSSTSKSKRGGGVGCGEMKTRQQPLTRGGGQH